MYVFAIVQHRRFLMITVPLFPAYQQVGGLRGLVFAGVLMAACKFRAIVIKRGLRVLFSFVLRIVAKSSYFRF